jgi:dihydrofolate reductase
METVMRQVTLMMGVSLDGYVASDRGHPGASVPEDPELIAWKVDRAAAAGAHLMGRVTYQEMAGHWPHSTGPYAAPMNDIPKVVFSKTLTEAEATWPTTQIARGDLATEIAAIRQQQGPDVIAWGGATLASALASQGSIDEYCLVIQPEALGRGQSVFAGLSGVMRLRLIEAQGFACGAVVQIYRPVG